MKLSELTPEQKRIAIAEACGWADLEIEGFSEYGVPCFMLMGSNGTGTRLMPPGYLNDLNAMASAESAKEMPYNTEYVWWLGRIACEARGMNPDKQNESDLNAMAVFATATQRADAFLLATGRAEL